MKSKLQNCFLITVVVVVVLYAMMPGSRLRELFQDCGEPTESQQYKDLEGSLTNWKWLALIFTIVGAGGAFWYGRQLGMGNQPISSARSYMQGKYSNMQGRYSNWKQSRRGNGAAGNGSGNGSN